MQIEGMPKAIVLCLCFLLTGFFDLYSQQTDIIVNVKHYNIKDGLSHRNVYCTFQDSRGFIWIGTQAGLQRFDGQNFQHFSKEKNGLLGNEVHQIIEDDNGWLWLINYKNPSSQSHAQALCFINIYTQEVHSIEQHFEATFPLEINEFYTIQKGKGGNPVLFQNLTSFFQYQPDNSFKAIYPEGISRFRNKFETWYTIDFFNGSEQEAADYLYQLYKIGIEISLPIDDRNGRMLFLEERNGIPMFFVLKNEDGYIYQKGDNGHSVLGTYHQFKDKHSDYLRGKFYYEKDKQHLWRFSQNDLKVYTKTFDLIYDFEKGNRNIIDAAINQLYIDRRGQVWLATQNGLHHIILKSNPFKRFAYAPIDEEELFELNSCRNLFIVSDTLFIQTFGNSKRNLNQVLSYDLKKNDFFKEETSKSLSKKLFGKEHGFRRILRNDKEELLFISSEKAGSYDITSQKYHPISLSFFEPFEAWGIFKDSNNDLWVGTTLGTLYSGTAKDTLQPYKKNNEFETFPSAEAYVFDQLDTEHLLIGTDKGIYELHYDKGVINRFWTGGEGKNYLPFDKIYHWYKETNEIYWLATKGGGLIKWNKATGFYQQFAAVDGLSNNVIYAVYKDDYGQLWLPSDYGLIRFDKNSYHVHAYLPNDGISNHEFNRLVHFQEKDGRLFFGGLNGVTAFYPKDLYSDTTAYIPPLRLLAYEQFNGTSGKLENQTAELHSTKQIKFRPGDRFATFKFALLDYSNPDKISYNYKIEGADKEWQNLYSNNLSISGLSYGQYTLKIKAQGADGQYSNTLQYPITVIRPFYLRNWFFLAMLIIAVVFAILFDAWRLRNLRRRNEKLENAVLERTHVINKQKQQLQHDKTLIEQQTIELKRLDKAKSKFFANVSHELRTPLTLILAPLEKVLSNAKQDEEDTHLLNLVKKNSLRLKRLISEILDLTKLEAENLTVYRTNVLLYKELCSITPSYQSYCQLNEIKFIFDYEPNEALRLRLDKKKFEVILNNLLSNAIKFTRPGDTIKLTVKEKANDLLIAVEDTGTGIHPDDLPLIFERYFQSSRPESSSEGGTGIGLSLSREYAQLFGGALNVESEWKKGTTFHFKFPKLNGLDNESLEDTENSELNILSGLATIETQPGASKAQSNNNHLSEDLPTILIVEDNTDLQYYLQFILKENYQTISVSNGKEAIELLRTTNELTTPDLIISDIMMPIMDGYQLLEELKSTDQFRHIPTIIITAKAAIMDRLQALRIGVDDYLIKPFIEEELIARVENLLANTYNRKEWYMNNKNSSFNDPAMKITHEDQKWLNNLEKLVATRMQDSQFNVDAMSKEMHLSRTQFFRKLKKLTGLSPSEYLIEARLQKARKLMENNTYSSVKAVAGAVGIQRIYFSAIYKKRFGTLPSEELQK